MIRKKRYIGNLWKITKETTKAWVEADPFRQSAVVAYYAVFSIPALLIIVIAVAGLAFGQEAVQGEISQHIKSALGNDAAVSIETIIAKASEQKTSILATIIGLITLILGSTGVFTELQTSLNQIWGVKVVVKKKWLKTLKNKLFSFGLVLSLGFLMLISLLLTTGLEMLSENIKTGAPDFLVFLFRILGFVLTFVIVTILFGLIFKILPDAKIKFRDVWIGAMVTTLLFILGKFGLGFYFAKASPSSIYGAAGSIVLIMLWVSYSCMILLFGAEFTKQYMLFHGRAIIPEKTAEIVKKDTPTDL